MKLHTYNTEAEQDDMAAAAATTAQAFRKLVRNGKYTTHTCGLGINWDVMHKKSSHIAK